MRTWIHAYNGNDQIVHIDDVSENSLDTFKCISCGQQMSAKIKGIKKDKHFAHYTTENCSGESDLHKLAKKYFVQVYKNCLDNKESYFVEYPIIVSCNYCNKYKQTGCTNLPSIDKFDLIKVFKNAILDEELKNYNRGNDSLKPDVLLLSKDEKKELFIEINYTHPCSDNKKNSGKRIIEFSLKNESDLSLINCKYIPYNDLNCRFISLKKKVNVGMYNFKSQNRNVVRINDCYVLFDILYVYKDGTTQKVTESILEYEERIKIEESVLDLKFTKVLCKTKESYLYRNAEKKTLIVLYKKNPKYQNCRICSHVENKDISLTGLFCKKMKKGVYPKDGLHCEIFKFFDKVYTHTAPAQPRD